MTWTDVLHTAYLVGICVLWYRMTKKAWNTAAVKHHDE